DPSTQANWQEVASEHVDFDWTTDFTKKTISGSATHLLRLKKDDVKEVIFDTVALDVTKVIVEDRPGNFELGPNHAVMGSPLRILLPPSRKVGDQLRVQIFYSTTKDCTAVQWLGKEQTQGKTFPFMFSQCQPIYARSMAPLQDSSSVKITYAAKVASVLPVLLSATVRVSPPSDSPAHGGKEIGKDVVTYEYKQPVPIPTYLIAIAVGNFGYRALPKVEGKEWTTGVWDEPELIDAAYWEFSEATGKFLATAETILPPLLFSYRSIHAHVAFCSFGGSSELLRDGDANNIWALLNHLTHSWFSNGVTYVAHLTSHHFWLNEGWTTYIERLLLQLLHTPADRGSSFLIGYKSLQDALKQYEENPKYQRLVID
ncbi:leukotriene A4 hydrolase N-terminal domain-containing protein, partial [Lentinus tigrinus ALCF2SS1-7]|uniref:leukotriene A4 hydrolase N-terminal domain-containing protein n=1 Tax=Lentinus tigrinus ALCF2SS1-7 TaxID=1328758 RepID=UPI00116615A4